MSRKEFVAKTAQKLLLKVAKTRGESKTYGQMNPETTTTEYLSVSTTDIAQAVIQARKLADELESYNEAPWIA